MPSVGLNARLEPVNLTTSPILELLNIHSASAGAMLVQPCDTFWATWPLDRCDRDGPGLLAELIARSVIDNLRRFVVANIAAPARLDAHQAPDGIWRSTRRAVDDYRK